MSEQRTATLLAILLDPDNRAALYDAGYQVYPALWVEDAETILSSLGTRLHRYGGPAELEPFMRWATRQVQKDARRYRITADILSEFGHLIRATISAEIDRPVRDYSADVDSIFWEVALLIFQHAHSLARRGSAKTSTRLVALIKKHVHFYHTGRWYRRHRLNAERVESGEPYGVEVLPAAELESELVSQNA